MSDKTSKKKRCCLPPEEFVTLTTAFAIALSRGLAVEEIESLSNFFDALSVQLAAIAAQKEFCEGEGSEIVV